MPEGLSFARLAGDRQPLKSQRKSQSTPPRPEANKLPANHHTWTPSTRTSQRNSLSSASQAAGNRSEAGEKVRVHLLLDEVSKLQPPVPSTHETTSQFLKHLTGGPTQKKNKKETIQCRSRSLTIAAAAGATSTTRRLISYSEQSAAYPSSTAVMFTRG